MLSSAASIRQAILLQEILGPPKGLSGFGGGRQDGSR
jgi:hypothetical protein